MMLSQLNNDFLWGKEKIHKINDKNSPKQRETIPEIKNFTVTNFIQPLQKHSTTLPLVYVCVYYILKKPLYKHREGGGGGGPRKLQEVGLVLCPLTHIHKPQLKHTRCLQTRIFLCCQFCYKVRFQYAAGLYSNTAQRTRDVLQGQEHEKLCFCKQKCCSKAPDNRKVFQYCISMMLSNTKIICTGGR